MELAVCLMVGQQNEVTNSAVDHALIQTSSILMKGEGPF